MSNSTTWLLISIGSIIGSIILSVIANLITSPVQNQLGRLSKQRAIKRIEELNKELMTITDFVDNREKLVMFLLEIILRTTVLSAISGIVSGFGYGLIQLASALLGFSSGFNDLIYGVISCSLAIISISIYTLGSRAVRAVNKVVNYPEYKKQIESYVASLTKGSGL